MTNAEKMEIKFYDKCVLTVLNALLSSQHSSREIARDVEEWNRYKSPEVKEKYFGDEIARNAFQITSSMIEQRRLRLKNEKAMP